LEFLTNNLQWSAASVADLYRCRWQIEVFFKQIKQSLQLCDFLGNSANAVRWQVWTALLLYVLMRFLCVISSWNHSFTRLFTLLRAALWRKIDLWDLLKFCGTAGGHFRYLATPQDAPGRSWRSFGLHRATAPTDELLNRTWRSKKRPRGVAPPRFSDELLFSRIRLVNLWDSIATRLKKSSYLHQ
jgi:hypothetical protein